MPKVYESYSPITVGDTLIPLAPVFQQIDATSGKRVPFPLTGLTIALTMTEKDTGQQKVCNDGWVMDSASLGQAHRAWNPGDVDTPGLWLLTFTLTDGSGHAVHGEEKWLDILP